jgi:hypothetical protein
LGRAGAASAAVTIVVLSAFVIANLTAGKAIAAAYSGALAAAVGIAWAHRSRRERLQTMKRVSPVTVTQARLFFSAGAIFCIAAGVAGFAGVFRNGLPIGVIGLITGALAIRLLWRSRHVQDPRKGSAATEPVMKSRQRHDDR